MAKWDEELVKANDIGDLVEQARSSFLKWGVQLLLSNLITWQPWLATPLVKQILEIVLTILFKILIDKGELGAFIINTRVLTSQQGKEYKEAVIKSLTAQTDEEWENAEREANEKFINLIKFNS